MKRIAAVRENGHGRVIVGPKILGKSYARIVAKQDGSGRIESYDIAARKWLVASETVTFAAVWSAPQVPFDLLPGITEPD